MSTTKKRARLADTSTVDEFREKAQKLIDEIAERRDALRRLIVDYSDIIASIDDAEDQFIAAMDTLSGLL